MSAPSPAAHLLDLPDELLLLILKQLDDIDILSSLFDIGNHRLHRLTCHKTSPTHLHFPLSLLSESRFDSLFERVTQQIFPRIHHRVESLTLPTELLERVLLRDHFPNLAELTLCSFQRDTSLHYFTDESSLGLTLKKQIRKLSLINDDSQLGFHPMEDYTELVYAHLVTFFDRLEEFHVIQRPLRDYPDLTICHFPHETFASPHLTSLSIKASTWSDCLCLLDGRLKQLRTFNVEVDSMKTDSSISHNSNDLPNLICFSLVHDNVFRAFPSQIRSLLQRMISLQRLTLHLLIACDDVFIDPLDLIEQLTSGMSQLHSLNFYARAENMIDQPNRYSFSHEAQRHEKRKRYGQMWDAVVRKCSKTYHHVFTLPFRSTQLMYIGRDFPETRFQHVVNLWITDVGQFNHDFFLRLARCFPVLQRLLVDEETSILGDEPDDFPEIRCGQVVQFPYLKTLYLFRAGLRCIEQFLNENITRLPRLTQLTIMHNKLALITHDFTRHETRRNCAHVIKLVTSAIMAGSKDYYDHFPSL